MMSRSNLLLLALLVVQLVLLAISAVTAGGTGARPVEPVLTGMHAAEIDQFSFSDDLGSEMTMARGDEGWVLPGADDFPVDGDKVEAILAKVAGLDTRRLVATKRANFVRLEVDEKDYRRKLRLESGDDSAELFLGGSGGVDTVYVRRAGEDNVYLGVGLNSWDLSTQISTWVDPSYVSVPPDDVLAITVQNGEGVFRFMREGDGLIYADLAEGEAFEDTKMPIVLRNAATIWLLEPLGLEALDEYELAEPQVTVHVRYRVHVEAEEPAESDAGAGSASDAEEPTEGETGAIEPEYREESYTLAFGAQFEDGVVLKSSDADYYVLARDTVFNAFNDLRRVDLVKAPEPAGDELNPTPMN